MSEQRVAVKAFDEVYREQWLPLVRLAVLLGAGREEAEDAVQSAFVSAHERWASVENPDAYLRRAVVNQVKGAQRRGFLRRVAPASPEPVSELPEVDETWRLVQRLPARQRAVVVLRFYEDLPLTAIADLLEKPAGTVRSDLHRALARLRRELS